MNLLDTKNTVCPQLQTVHHPNLLGHEQGYTIEVNCLSTAAKIFPNYDHVLSFSKIHPARAPGYAPESDHF